MEAAKTQLLSGERRVFEFYLCKVGAQLVTDALSLAALHYRCLGTSGRDLWRGAIWVSFLRMFTSALSPLTLL